MKCRAIRTRLMRISAVTSLIVLCVSSLVHAQNVKPKVGDRVETNVNFFLNTNPSDIVWRKATVSQIFETRNQDAGIEKDNVIVAIADAVTSQGSDTLIEPGLLAELNIPNSKSGTVRAKTMSKIVKTPTGRDRFHTVSVIVTDRRYVWIHRRVVTTEFMTVLDETGAIVGQRMWTETGRAEMPLATANRISEEDVISWANWLISGQFSANVKWNGSRGTRYLVKSDDAKKYLLGETYVRSTTQQ